MLYKNNTICRSWPFAGYWQKNVELTEKSLPILV